MENTNLAQQAFTIVRQAINQATEKGAFNLNDVFIISKSLSVLNDLVQEQQSENEELEKK